jgi:hypothetical protein
VLADRGGGAWRLAVAGGGLPKVDADVSRFALTDGGATATGRIKARAPSRRWKTAWSTRRAR